MTLKTDEQERGLSLKGADTHYNEPVTNTTTPAEYPEQSSIAADTYDKQTTEFYPGFDEPYVSTSTSTVKKNISFKEFYKDYCSSNTKRNINGSAIVLYVCFGITLALAFAASALGMDLWASIIDAILVLGLALGIHIGKSRVCAVIILVYSIINCIYSLIATGRMSGYLVIIAGVYATIYTFKARKEYNEYINS